MNETFLPALVGAPLVALSAWRVRALTPSGAVAAAGVGFCHLAFGGWLGAGALLAFFGTSTALSKLGKRRKDALGFEKSSRRDALQVLANGGVAALCASLGWTEAMLGALAAANADTWATEIGSLFGGTPRKITTLKPAAVGESGAISLAGTLAALAGAALIAAFAWMPPSPGGLGEILCGSAGRLSWGALRLASRRDAPGAVARPRDRALHRTAERQARARPEFSEQRRRELPRHPLRSRRRSDDVENLSEPDELSRNIS